MLLIERMMAAVANFIACDLFGLDSRDVERARSEQTARAAERTTPRTKRQVVVRFGR